MTAMNSKLWFQVVLLSGLLLQGCAHPDPPQKPAWRDASYVLMLASFNVPSYRNQMSLIVRKGMSREEVFAVTGEPHVAIQGPPRFDDDYEEGWYWGHPDLTGYVELRFTRGELDAIVAFNTPRVDHWPMLRPAEDRRPVARLGLMKYRTFSDPTSGR